MSFLGHYDALLLDSDDLHVIPDESESLGMTIVSSAPSFEEEIVFEWPSQTQSQSSSQSQFMSISTHESMDSLTTNSEHWILTSSPRDMCLVIPCDENEISNNSNHPSELSFHPSSVPSSDCASDLWASSCSSSSSSRTNDNDSIQQPQQRCEDSSWEHIHRVCHDDRGVYLQTTAASNSSIVSAPWSSWYQKLSTEDEWEELKLRIQDIFLAFQPDDFESYTADELLALWIEQEEELFWSHKESRSCVDSNQQYHWGEAVAVAAAVASFGVFMLRRS